MLAPPLMTCVRWAGIAKSVRWFVENYDAARK